MPERSVTATNDSLAVILAAERGGLGRTPNSKRFSGSHQGHVFHGEQLINSQDLCVAVLVVFMSGFAEWMKKEEGGPP